MRGRLTYEMEMGESQYWLFTPETSIHTYTGSCPWGSDPCPAVDNPDGEHWRYDGAFTPSDGDLITFEATGRQISWLSDIPWRAYPKALGGGYVVDVVRMVQDTLF